MYRLALRLQNFTGRLPADVSDLTLKLAYSRFFRIVTRHLPQRFLADGKLILLKPVLLKLLGNQMLHCDMHLLILCIAADLNYLHTVQKGPWDWLQGVRSSNKKDL